MPRTASRGGGKKGGARRAAVVLVAGAAVVLAAAAGASAATDVKPYAVPVSTLYETRPLLSVGEGATWTEDPSLTYRMVGIPDGLALRRHAKRSRSVLYMNHEIGKATVSEPIVGSPQYRGAFVDRWVLDRRGNPLRGERAYDWVFMEDTLIGPAADTGNTTPAFGRFCASSVANRRHGFDRWMYLTNEEANGANTFDGRGGLSVAIFDDEAHALPKLGRFAKENTLVQPKRGRQTVVLSLEDGQDRLTNQLYLYVGWKERGRDATVLGRNGLNNGKLYVLRSLDPALASERTFLAGSVAVEWVEVPNAENLSDVELEAASAALGAMTFVRLEDGVFNPNDRNEFFFDSTGSSSGRDNGVNELGRLYSLHLHPRDPLRPGTLELVFDADEVVAAGGDTAISLDNMDASRRYLMISEDGTPEGRAAMAALGRDGSIWRFELRRGSGPRLGVKPESAERIVQVNPPGRDGLPVGAGVWEMSGIVGTGARFGRDSWLADVQATGIPEPLLIEDGQLFLLRRAR